MTLGQWNPLRIGLIVLASITIIYLIVQIIVMSSVHSIVESHTGQNFMGHPLMVYRIVMGIISMSLSIYTIVICCLKKRPTLFDINMWAYLFEATFFVALIIVSAIVVTARAGKIQTSLERNCRQLTDIEKTSRTATVELNKWQSDYKNWLSIYGTSNPHPPPDITKLKSIHVPDISTVKFKSLCGWMPRSLKFAGVYPVLMTDLVSLLLLCGKAWIAYVIQNHCDAKVEKSEKVVTTTEKEKHHEPKPKRITKSRPKRITKSQAKSRPAGATAAAAKKKKKPSQKKQPSPMQPPAPSATQVKSEDLGPEWDLPIVSFNGIPPPKPASKKPSLKEPGEQPGGERAQGLTPDQLGFKQSEENPPPPPPRPALGTM